jgi:hypothetical protein
LQKQFSVLRPTLDRILLTKYDSYTIVSISVVAILVFRQKVLCSAEEQRQKHLVIWL